MSSSTVLFILGGSGDLARKKLYPVLERLLSKGRLKSLKEVYALGRNVQGVKDYVGSIGEHLHKLLTTAEFDVNNREDYKALADIIGKLGHSELIFYLALPPQLFETTIVNLGSLLRKFSNPRKIVIEKPFGFNLSSAKKLNFQLKRYFTESEIYRIDHFLGKAPIQNILSVRFSNYTFEGIWNKNFIDNIQISALEEVGVEGREGYYDSVGALRDMVQNHLLQILSFLTMEPPAVMDADKIRDEKAKVLSSIRRLSNTDIDRYAVRGKYRGYRGSAETFTALKLFIDNFRWEGVPFYLRTGKKLKEKKTQVVVVFKEVPGNFGRLLGCLPKQNKLVFDIAPHSGVRFFFEMAPPEGFLACPVERSMEIDLSRELGEVPEAYETLIEDVFEGNQTLFIREDESELAWEIVQDIINAWEERESEIPVYEPGTYGPQEAVELLLKENREWVLV